MATAAPCNLHPIGVLMYHLKRQHVLGPAAQGRHVVCVPQPQPAEKAQCSACHTLQQTLYSLYT